MIKLNLKLFIINIEQKLKQYYEAESKYLCYISRYKCFSWICAPHIDNDDQSNLYNFVLIHIKSHAKHNPRKMLQNKKIKLDKFILKMSFKISLRRISSHFFHFYCNVWGNFILPLLLFTREALSRSIPTSLILLITNIFPSLLGLRHNNHT